MRDLSNRLWRTGHCLGCARELRLEPYTGQVGMVVYQGDGLNVYCLSCTDRMFPPRTGERERRLRKE